jgi:hypothetical protein
MYLYTQNKNDFVSSTFNISGDPPIYNVGHTRIEDPIQINGCSLWIKVEGGFTQGECTNTGYRNSNIF